MEILLSDLEHLMVNFILVWVRIGAMILSMPVIGVKVLPARFKIMLSLGITAAVLPAITYHPDYSFFSGYTLVNLVNQFLIGIVVGLTLQIIFQLFVMAGETISMQGGLGMAVMNDPTLDAQVPMVSQLFLMLCTLLFFILDGHLVTFKLIAESFASLPLHTKFLSPDALFKVVKLGGWMLQTSFKIAIPMVTGLLMIQITMGLLTRVSPQLNIFSIGFPVIMVLSVSVLWAKIPVIKDHFDDIYSYGIQFINDEIIRGSYGRK